jgi:hypothetical protein
MSTGKSLMGLMCSLLIVTSVAAGEDEMQAWSDPVNGLQARLILIEKPREYGVRWLVPYLELRNVRDVANAMQVNCGNRHLKIELVDEGGKVVRDGWSLPRSGPAPDLDTVILPMDSFMRISLECRNWGIRKDAAAMVSTDSGAWHITQEERGKVFLRATMTGEESFPRWKQWHGKLQTPSIAVDWDSTAE